MTGPQPPNPPPALTPRPLMVRVAAAAAALGLVVALPLGVYLYGNTNDQWRPLAGAFLVASIGGPILWFLRTRGRPGAPRDGVIGAGGGDDGEP